MNSFFHNVYFSYKEFRKVLKLFSLYILEAIKTTIYRHKMLFYCPLNILIWLVWSLVVIYLQIPLTYIERYFLFTFCIYNNFTKIKLNADPKANPTPKNAAIMLLARSLSQSLTCAGALINPMFAKYPLLTANTTINVI